MLQNFENNTLLNVKADYLLKKNSKLDDHDIGKVMKNIGSNVRHWMVTVSRP